MPTTTTQTASYYFIIFASGMLFAWLIKQYRYSHTTTKKQRGEEMLNREQERRRTENSRDRELRTEN
jgi:hypothetical protein